MNTATIVRDEAKKVLTIEEQRRQWQRADEMQIEEEETLRASLGITDAQFEARRALNYKPETLAERRARESEERICEVLAIQTERTIERRKIAFEETGDAMGYLLLRVLELETERNHAIKLAAKYQNFAAALCKERMKQIETARKLAGEL